MTVAFLITTPYQIYHYKWIAAHLDDVAVVLEARDNDLGISEAFVKEHLPECHVRWVPQENLATLDGQYEVLVCQTPILPLTFPRRSYVVAQQYSLAKERYQYGVWRAHAHLNLMYGPYAVEKVSGFSHAVAVGNPLLDPHFATVAPEHRGLASRDRTPRLLYMPTYGELSSLRSVLAKLRSTDAEVTVKLHHAEDREAVASLLDGFRVVYADADPVALLRAHDGVITDFSGAAFDALYAGRPVVVTGTVDDGAGDAERLSQADRERSTLRGVAGTWDGHDDPVEALAAAEHLLHTPAYKEFLDRMFVNPGRAGEACAQEIRRLLDEGPAEHFGAEQVRTATRRYITQNRELRALQPRPTRSSPGATGSAGGSGARLAYVRTRRFLARSERLRRAVKWARYQRAHLSRRREEQRARPSGPLPPPRPAERREEVFRLLAPLLAQAGVRVAREHDAPGCDLAVLGDARRSVLEALHNLGEQRPDMIVRVGAGTQIMTTLPASRLRFVDVATAQWLEIGSTMERGTYRVDGLLTMLFVEYDRARNRYLAQRTRADRVDWTEEFARSDTREPAAVTVGVRHPHVAEPVDVVYTWVDSGDPAWREAHRRYSQEHQVHNPSANNAERYVSREELRFSLRTLWMFAPFVRHIYLVTADQRPPWLAEDDPRVRIVSHREIFPDPARLPTFNSHAIEACLHRIPGLSENFLYFNDDVLVGRELRVDDFYTQAGLAKVRFAPTQYIYQGRPEPDAIPTDWAAFNAISLLQRDFGLRFDRRVQHVPLVLRRSVLEEIEQRYAEEVDRTRRARFRSPTDLALPSMFAQFYGVATGRAVEWPTSRHEYLYLDTGRRDALERFRQIRSVRPKFFCLNATRYAEIGLVDQARLLHDFLTPAFPTPAPWEVAEAPADTPPPTASASA